MKQINSDIETKEGYQKKMTLLKDEYDSKLQKINTSFTTKLSEIEKIHKQQIEIERNILLNSWRWRIGNFQVNMILAIKDFFICIFRIINGQKYLARKSKVLISETSDSSFLESEYSYYPNIPQKPSIACIFDTFTQTCFQPEFNIINPYPDNWKYLIKNSKVDAFFCESAWKGNNSSWRFHLGKIGDLKKAGLNDMLNFCKNENIPTLFWNKEDPVHFDHFIEDAKNFDYIFTSDASSIPNYRKVVRHDRIFALPFAAQGKIHNPVRSEQRSRNVCFAGSWYNTKYAERILDMELILKPAIEFGLEIFDRNHGATGYEKVMYAFPEKYQPFIKGKLEYGEMVNAYKNYKAFLNINSVRYSPTMFSRRVFELLACGTPVISTWSEGIVNLLGEDAVLFTETHEDTRKHLDKLLNDENFWWRQSLRGIRRVMENHTYSQRTEFLFNTIGLDTGQKNQVRFLLTVNISSIEDAQYIASLIKQQHYTHFEIVLALPEEVISVSENKTLIHDLFKPFDVDLVQSSEESLLKAINSSMNCGYVAFLSADHYYGPNYLYDFALATYYSSANVFGKFSCFGRNDSGSIIWLNKGSEYQFCNMVYSTSLVCSIKDIGQFGLSGILKDQPITHEKYGILAIDPFNFILNGKFTPVEIRRKIDL